MFYTKKSEPKKQNQDYDWLLATVESVGKILFFFFTQPYRGIIYRVKENPNHLFYMLCVQAGGLLVGVFGGFQWLYRVYEESFWVRVISPEIFRHIQLWTFLFIGHLYLFVWRMPWLRRESVYNRDFERLGLVPACNGGKIKLLTDMKVDEEQRCLIVANPGLSLSTYQARKEDIEAMLKKNITDISFGEDSHIVKLTYRTMDFPRVVRYADFHKGVEAPDGKFGVGLALTGEKIFCSLREMVHLLVAGETGGGKSTFLRQFIVDILKFKEPTKLYLIDLKGGVEFLPFKGHPQINLVSEHEKAANVLITLNNELDDRLKLFEEHGVNDLDSFNHKTDGGLPRIVLVVDECAEIFMRSNHDEKMKTYINILRLKIGRLARLSRAVGIHLVLATQRPDKDAIDMQTKDNLVSRLCFRVNNDYASTMVLRDGRAAKLPKINGRAIWKGTGDELELQIPYLGQEEVQALI